MSDNPPLEKQSLIIAQIDKLIALTKQKVELLEQMRLNLLVQWSVRGDPIAYKRIMSADRYGETIMPRAPYKARQYFKMFIETWRAQNETKRIPCQYCNGTGFVHGSCCRTCEGSMSVIVKGTEV